MSAHPKFLVVCGVTMSRARAYNLLLLGGLTLTKVKGFLQGLHGFQKGFHITILKVAIPRQKLTK